MGGSRDSWGLLKALRKHGQGLPICPSPGDLWGRRMGGEEEFPGKMYRLAWGPQHTVSEGPPEELWADASTPKVPFYLGTVVLLVGLGEHACLAPFLWADQLSGRQNRPFFHGEAGGQGVQPEAALVRTQQDPQNLPNLLTLHGWAGKSEGQPRVSKGRWQRLSLCGLDRAAHCCGLTSPTAVSVVGQPVSPLPSPVLAHLAVGPKSVCVAAGTVHYGLLNQFGSPLGQ